MGGVERQPGGNAVRLLGNARRRRVGLALLALLIGWIVWLQGSESRYEGWRRLLIELSRSCVFAWSALFVLDVCLDAALEQLHVC